MIDPTEERFIPLIKRAGSFKSVSIWEVDWSTRMHNLLVNYHSHIKTTAELAAMSDHDLLKFRGFGRTIVNEIHAAFGLPPLPLPLPRHGPRATRTVYVLHSGYSAKDDRQEGAWRGWEKCVGLGSRGTITFETREEAAEYLANMDANLRHYFRVWPINIIEPWVGTAPPEEP